MAFCRRCGDIVSSARCKCGGLPVAPVVPWNQSTSTNNEKHDRWSKTYVSRSKSTSPTRAVSAQPSSSVEPSTTDTGPPQRSPTPGRRFPRPLSSSQSTSSISNRVSAYINNSTSQSSRPPSPLKQSITGPAPEADILPSIQPNDPTLSKVYGSLLQPKETLQTYSCGICSTPFPPDATIYPHPTAPSTSQYLCRACFEENGGSKGPCPTCSRPVLALKAEGGFIHANGQYWHKRCFVCNGCSKNIGDTPMVDLFGRPSCASCFDTCLKRDPTTPKKQIVTSNNNSPRPRPSNTGVTPDPKKRQSTEGSPAFVEELEQRLGILRSREGSPAVSDFSVKPSEIARDSPATRPRRSGSLPATQPSTENRPNPVSPTRTSQPLREPTQQIRASLDPGMNVTQVRTPISPTRTRAVSSVETSSSDPIAAMKQRFLRNSMSSPRSPTAASQELQKEAPLRQSRSSASLKSQDRPQPRGDYLDDETATSPKFVRTRSQGDHLEDNPLAPLRFDCSMSSVSTTAWARPPKEGASASSIQRSASKPQREYPDDSPVNSPKSEPALELSDSMSQSSLSELDSTPPPKYGEAIDDVFSIRSGNDSELDHNTLQRDLYDDLSKVLMPENTGGSKILMVAPQEPLGRKASIRSVRAIHTGDTGNFDTTPNLKPMTELPPLDEEEIDGLVESTRCAGCRQSLFSIHGECKFVNVPGDRMDAPPVSYHVECFKCIVCKEVFSETTSGQAAFVKVDGGPCHVECAPVKKITIHKSPSLGSIKLNRDSINNTPTPAMKSPPSYRSSTRTSSSRLDQAPLSPPPVTTNTTGRRFGSSSSCPGCKKPVSPMEPGVVPGPHGTRWHASCLVCGGKKEPVKGRPMSWLVREEKKKREPGCGKKLDSAAKSGPEGGVWCRECLLLIGVGGSPQTSPIKASATLDNFGTPVTSPKVSQQSTGTTLARQFTGMGSGGEAGLMRQLTGSGLNPTRSISPTKQLSATRPRPKSVIGMRSAKSVDEGRGMFLRRGTGLEIRYTAGAVSGAGSPRHFLSNAMRSKVALVGGAVSDVAIDAALNTIPFTSIGITAFAAFTILLVLRRINATSSLLYLSSFLSFAASILDLGLLIFKVSDGKSYVTALINTREVGFALSYGFSYLFYWLLVARCPREECSPENNEHSASWSRWGSIGLILKWGILILILIDTILQIVWRVSPASTKFATLYIAESTMQIVISAFLLLKLVLNMLVSPLDSWWRRLTPNIVPIIALGMSAALAIANLVTSAFSETTLGRFFRAIEFYLLIVYAVIASLHISNQRRLSDDDVSSLKSNEKFIDPRATAYVNPIGVLVQRQSSIVGDRRSRTSRRTSPLSWIMSKAAQRSELFGEGAVARAEQGNAAGPSQGIRQSRTFQSFLPSSNSSEDDITPPREQRATGSFIPSYYGMVRSSAVYMPQTTASLTRATESPIYGLNGIARPPLRQPQLQPPRPDSETSISELLRQQNELDQSIAALKLISPQADASPELPAVSMDGEEILLSPQMPEKLDRGAGSDRVTSSITGRRIESESNRSDFSLSVFPDPPKVPAAEPGPPSKRRVVVRAPDDEKNRGAEAPNSGGPAFIGQYDLNARFGSTGTAYDVTSFIGGLTVESGGALLSAAAPSSNGPLVGIAETPSDAQGSRQASPDLRSARRESQPLLLRPVQVKGRDGVQKSISQPRRVSANETAPGAFEQPRRPPVVR